MIETDWYRFRLAFGKFTDAWVQLAKAPGSLVSEKVADWTKYPIALGILFGLVWLVAFLLSRSEYSLFSTCAAMWFLSSAVVVFFNWMNGNMKKKDMG